MPEHTPSKVILKQSGIVIEFIRIEPSFLRIFSNIYSGYLNSNSNLYSVSVATSVLAEVQNVEIGYKYSKIVTNEKVVSLKF